ncbi:MAG: hypothetical protein IKN53_06470, partial [Oscillibacter sp.]|nr:hypothetical protein [Oscillibacter sp.]
MSASREKKIRQEQTASGYVDPKAAKEAEARKAEKRSNVLYAAIAAVFVLAVVASVIWKSNVIPRNTKAVTIDGQSYTASETSFFYQNVYRTFLNNYSYYLSYAGLDTSAPLADQTVNETAASLFGIEEGTNWRDYFLDRAVEQMTSVQNGLKKAS